MATTTNLSTLKINYLTQAQFDALTTKEANEIYLTPDASITGVTAGTGLSGGGSSGGITLSLASVSRTNNTSTASPSHGGTFTAIDSVTTDSYGRVTAVNTKTVTLPSDNNTDTLVTQAYSTTNSSYPLLFSATSGVSSTSSRGATTAILNNAIYANPSTGNLQVTKLNSYTPGAAMAKAVDTSISAGSSSANLPTSAAVAAFVEGKGYITSYTDTNTASAVDNILDGSNSGTAITYAPYTAQQSKLSFDTSSTNPSRTDRLNLNGYLYATRLYSGGAQVLTSYTETDPTVPSWAKASSKPTYTASEVGALSSSTTYVSTITTTAGTHSAISSKSGAVSFNVPTKTSHLTNDSGFITSYTDEKVTNTTVTAATTYYITGGTSSSTTTGGLSKHASANLYVTADSGTGGYTRLALGNTTATSSAGGKEGQIRLYGTTATYYIDLKAGAPSANRTITFPNATGTVALTSDIPSVPSITLNGSSTTSPSFYAPTSAGTSGYYLKSNGSGAPSWTSFPTIPSITLNGSSTTSPSFYAPTSAGTSGYYLKSNGSGAPSWTAFPTIPDVSGYVPITSDSVTIKSNDFRIQNKAGNTSQAGASYPYVTSIHIGDGREVTIDEYGDGYLGIHSKYGIFLQSNSTAIEVYSASKTYSLNALVWYDRKYYRCTTAITTAEAWTSGHWTQVPASTGQIVVDGSIQPVTTGTKDLGTSSYKWNNLYVNNINGVSVPSSPKFTDDDTKNTAGSTDTSSKIYLIGATSQAANPQTYSHDTAYVGTDGCLYSGGSKVLTAHQTAVTSITTSAGAHSTKSSATGAVSFNIPTKTSHLTNDSGFITSSAVPSTNSILELIYPVGSIYVSTVNSNPRDLFAFGTWERIEGKFLLSADSTYTAGKTGGNADAIIPYHNHSVSNVSITSSGGHTHTITAKYSSNALAAGSARVQFANDGANTSTSMATIASNTGTHTHGVPAHNTNYAGDEDNLAGANMPPYLAVYMWKRTA